MESTQEAKGTGKNSAWVQKPVLHADAGPAISPAGIPMYAEITKPTATLHNEAITSSTKRPAIISSRKLFQTAPGEGNA